MRSEALPAEAEMVTGAVLRVYKFPAYVNMAATGASHAHNTQLAVHVFILGDDVTPDWSVFRRITSCTCHRLLLRSQSVVGNDLRIY